MIKLYQRVPHFIGSNATPDDLILSEKEQTQLLKSECWVQEKLDGVAVAIAWVNRRELAWELRPPWQGALNGALEHRLDLYMRQRKNALRALLKPGMILYGEWLGHRVSVHYPHLSDFFYCYAMRSSDGRYLPLPKVHQLCKNVGLSINEPLWKGPLESIEALRKLVGFSQFSNERMEGLIVKKAHITKGSYCAKWVEPEYVKIHAGLLSGERNGIVPTQASQVWPPSRQRSACESSSPVSS